MNGPRTTAPPNRLPADVIPHSRPAPRTSTAVAIPAAVDHRRTVRARQLVGTGPSGCSCRARLRFHHRCRRMYRVGRFRICSDRANPSLRCVVVNGVIGKKHPPGKNVVKWAASRIAGRLGQVYGTKSSLTASPPTDVGLFPVPVAAACKCYR